MTDFDYDENEEWDETSCVECGEVDCGSDCQSCGNALCGRCGHSDGGNMNGRICSDCNQSWKCVHCGTEVSPPEIPQCKSRPGEECEDYRAG